MDKGAFEEIAQRVFDGLPAPFRDAVDNVAIAVEESPDPRVERRRKGYRPGALLLGLYEGIPLPRRGNDYGMYPVVPDRITLYRENIERFAATAEDIPGVIRDTLIHEIGHYFGMTERQIRAAGY
jgi:predicted Zn-dependent protease with MMP-like domain